MDTISDMLTIIKNGQAVLKTKITVPFSNFKYEILKILEKHNFLEKIEKKGRKIKKIEIFLKYNKDKMPVISGFKRISKPGQRIYEGFRKIKLSRGRKITIISTPKGLMTIQEAKKQKLGGEIICEVW